MGLVRTTPPASEPLTRADVMTHLRLDSSNVEPVPGAPSVALAGAGAGNVTAGAHRYAVTFVTADGETDPGAPSAAVTVADAAVNGKVTVSAIPLGGSAVTARKLYRTIAAGTTYLLLATIADNTTTTYTDNIADGSLGAGVPTENTTGDPYLSQLIVAAREYAETFLGRALIKQAWTLTQDSFPWCDVLELPRPSLISVEEVRYTDTAGDAQVLDPTWYTVEAAELPGRLVLDYGRQWPSTRSQRNAVAVDFIAGYGARAAVPDAIKRAMLLLIGAWYELRDTGEIPPAATSLLWQHRVVEA